MNEIGKLLYERRVFEIAGNDVAVKKIDEIIMRIRKEQKDGQFKIYCSSNTDK